jgi:NAD(P)-dependent dehydrogenase (short-subunit alcohol dehydrogenase family)
MRPIAFVTGAARRVGAHLCRNLARVGYDIALHYNTSAKSATALKFELEQHGSSVRLFQADLCKREDRERLVHELQNYLSGTDRPLDLLIHNASIFPRGEFSNLNDALLHTLFTLHSTAPLLLTQAMRPFLERAKDGLVVSIGDSACDEYWPNHFAYTLSKQALRNAGTSMAQELAPKIRVCTLEPGVLSSGEGARLRHLTKEAGRPEALWRALFYLIASPFVTGEILKVDGGRHLGKR